MIDEIMALVEGGDADAAVALVRSEGPPREVAARFVVLVHELYWKAKDLGTVVVIARGGIQYCLAMRDGATNADDAAWFGRQAQVLANNLGSFTWSGWDEPGITPSAEEMAAGLDAAKLNLRLATELGYESDRIANARWLLGAHLLAAGDAAGALAQFEQCGPEMRPLFAGYVALAKVALGIAGAQREFDDLLEAMATQGDEGAVFNRSQLVTAHRVFVDDVRGVDRLLR